MYSRDSCQHSRDTSRRMYNGKRLIGAAKSKQTTMRERNTPCVHCALFFISDNLPDTIVLLWCCPVRCYVAELVPHFTLHALRSALYMLFPGL